MVFSFGEGIVQLDLVEKKIYSILMELNALLLNIRNDCRRSKTFEFGANITKHYFEASTKL